LVIMKIAMLACGSSASVVSTTNPP
jgi:hypothetical protein